MTSALAALLALLVQTPAAAPADPQRMDFVCAVTDDAGAKTEQRFSVDLKASAWCSRENACKEVKTLFGLKGSRIVLESSQLEDAAFESSIDRAGGAYASYTAIGDPPLRSDSKGVCTTAPFTPFNVTVSEKALKP